MRSTRLVFRRYAVRSFSVAAVLLGLGLVSCQQTSYARRAPGLPRGCKPDEPPTTAKELQACLDSLRFNDIEAVGDKQPLMINPPCPATCRYGPLATIQPEIHSHLYEDEEMKQGRIIARFFLDSAETTSYPKLGLVPKGITYWWVQRTSKETDGKVTGRSVYVTLAGGEVKQTEDRVNNPLGYVYHEGAFQQAVARWIWDPNDDKPQGNCGSGCCH
jgi:hypothetical protein